MNELEDLYETEANDRLRRLIGYIGRFRESVNYNKFKADDYPIGSGEIESAHKSIPQERLKIPDAGWKEESINPMLALRILRTNEWCHSCKNSVRFGHRPEPEKSIIKAHQEPMLDRNHP